MNPSLSPYQYKQLVYCKIFGIKLLYHFHDPPSYTFHNCTNHYGWGYHNPFQSSAEIAEIRHLLAGDLSHVDSLVFQ